MTSSSGVFRGSLDPELQRFESSAPTANFEKSVRDVLEWLPFNPVQNWSALDEPTVAADKVSTWFPSPTANFEKSVGDVLERLPFNPVQPWSATDEPSVVANKVSTWFPSDKSPVFYGPKQDGRTPLSYAGLHQQIRQSPSYQVHHVVAVLLPPFMLAEMVVVLVSLLSQNRLVTVAPLDPNMSNQKLAMAVRQLQCTALVTTVDLLERLKEEETLGNVSGADFKDVRVVQPSDTVVGTVEWTVLRSEKDMETTHASDSPPALLLRTSGTTATPKIVPITRTNLLYNALCLSASLELGRDDIGCNAMPLYHIGGIACALLSVLVSGSAVVMMRGPFDADAFLDCLCDVSSHATPTWYYGVPSMHKTLVLTAQARLRETSAGENLVFVSVPNRLRFIRSGAAYLSPDTALALSNVFGGRPVIPTYSMSECMPVCSSHASPVVWKNSSANEVVLELPVGPAIGCSMSIINADGLVLPYGSIGEVALKGIGVLQAYAGIPRQDSHTSDGWFRTGDMGMLDRTGNLTLTGRIKEMIKRGGEQVWPNEIDRVVEQVEGVILAVSFGVPNPLWGEEVAVAVVISKDGPDSRDSLKREIFAVCKSQLDLSAVPSQLIFVDSPDSLPKSSTGKYLRTQMASHLNAEPVDVVTLNVLQQMVPSDQDGAPETALHTDVPPSSALNGLRFLVACFVVQMHVGLYPNIAWLKVQSFSVNMQIFFMLGAFQLACSTKASQLNWAHFVGTKIGAMHALFLVTQLIALPSYLLFLCGPDGYYESFEDERCTQYLAGMLAAFVFKTATGLFPVDDTNIPSWFQGVFYTFLILFPWLNSRLLSSSAGHLRHVFAVNILIATFAFAPLFGLLHLYELTYFAVSWFPALVSGTIAGYAFVRSEMARQASEGVVNWRLSPSVWGWITDIASVIFLFLEIAVVFSNDCLWIKAETFEEMRPDQPMPSDTERYDGQTFVRACSVSYDEFVDFVFPEEDGFYLGRWETELGEYIGFARLGTPLTLLWLYGMAHGRGVTVRLMNGVILQRLSHLAYPLYLLHVPIARYYWYISRGPEAEHWWGEAEYPIPLDWYEVFLVILVSLVIGYLLDRFAVQHLSTYTVRVGIATCQFISRRCFCCCASRAEQEECTTKGNLVVVQTLVRDLTGSNGIDRQTHLGDLGLDSLGAAALLGILKARITTAKTLSIQQLRGMETVGDLVDFLDSQESPVSHGELDI